MSDLAATILRNLHRCRAITAPFGQDWVPMTVVIRAQRSDHTNSEIRDAVQSLVDSRQVEKRVEWHGRDAGGHVRVMP